MAKKETNEVPGQLVLIDVDDPKYKELKKELLKLDKLTEANKEEGAARRAGLKKQKDSVLAEISNTGDMPDAAGVYHFVLAGKQWDISQPAQLKIKKHNVKDADPDKGETDKGATE